MSEASGISIRKRWCSAIAPHGPPAHATPPVRLIDNPGRIAPSGLNAALALAQGAIIVRVDGHCEIAPDYLRQCVRHLQSGAVDGVGGPLETIGLTPVARAIAGIRR